MKKQPQPTLQDAADTSDAADTALSGALDRSVAINQWSFGMRSFLFFVQGAMPLLLYLAFLAGVEANLYSWFTAAWLAAFILLAISLALAYGVKAGTSSGLLFSGILGCSAALAAYAWYAVGNGPAAGIGLLLFTLAALFRVRRWLVNRVTAVDGRGAFIVDTVAILLVGVYCMLILALDSSNSVIISFTALFGCLVALSRLYLLWFMERQISGSPLSTKTAWLPFLIMALLAAVFGPSLLFHSITGLAGLIGILLLPVVFLVQLLHLHLHLPTGYLGGNHPLVSKAIPPQWQRAATPPAWTHLIPIAVLILLFLVLIYLLFRKNKNKTDQGEISEQTAEVLERKAIRSQDGLSFLSTRDPVRLRIQQWLRSQEKEGIQLHSTETIRHFHQRSGPLPEENLLEQYEDHRYNSHSGGNRSHEPG